MTLGLTLCILTKQGHKQLAIITGTLQFGNNGVDDHINPSPHPLFATTQHKITQWNVKFGYVCQSIKSGVVAASSTKGLTPNQGLWDLWPVAQKPQPKQILF